MVLSETRVCKFSSSDCDKTSVGEFSITAVTKTTTTAGCSAIGSISALFTRISLDFSFSSTSSISTLSSCTFSPKSFPILSAQAFSASDSNVSFSSSSRTKASSTFSSLVSTLSLFSWTASFSAETKSVLVASVFPTAFTASTCLAASCLAR